MKNYSVPPAPVLRGTTSLASLILRIRSRLSITKKELDKRRAEYECKRKEKRAG